MTVQQLRTRVRAVLRHAPGWAAAILLYAAARTFTAVVSLWFAARQPENLWTPAHPGYGEYASMWDGARYRQIAEHGYPIPFPVDAAGEPRQSEWAFYPAYPGLVRMLLEATGLPFTVVAPALSLLLGGVAVVALHLLFEDVVGRRRALTATALVVTFPTAAVLGYSYSEATSLAALAWCLLLVHRGQYGLAVFPAVLLGLSRPVGLAFGLAVAVLLVIELHRRRGGGRGPGRVPGLVLLGVCTGLTSLVFPAVVAVVSGAPDGYTRLQVAWRVQDHMEYVTPWLWMARYLFGPVWGLVALVTLGCALVVTLASSRLRELGPVVWAWTFAYAVYLVVVVDPFSSIFRFLLLFAPAAPALAGRSRRYWWPALLVVLFSCLQVAWIGVLWQFTPPSDYPP